MKLEARWWTNIRYAKICIKILLNQNILEFSLISLQNNPKVAVVQNIRRLPYIR